MRTAIAFLVAAFVLPLFAEDDKPAPLETPEQAWRAFQKAAIAGEPDAVWKFWSKELRNERIEAFRPLRDSWVGSEAWLEEMSKLSGKTPEQLKAMTIEELTRVVVVADGVDYPRRMDRYEYAGAEIKGDVAIVTMREMKGGKLGDESQTMLVLEDGRWKWMPDLIPVFDREEDGIAAASPREAFNELRDAVECRNIEAVWAHFCPRSRKFLVETLTPAIEKTRQDAELLEKISRRTGTAPEDLEAMEPEEFVKMMVVADDAQSADHLSWMEWVSTEVTDARAILTLRDRKTGDLEQRVMVRSADKRWQYDVEATEAIREKSK